MAKVYDVRVFIQQPEITGILRTAGCFETGKVIGGFYDFKITAEKAMTIADQTEFLNLLLKKNEIVYAQMCKRFILANEVTVLSDGHRFISVTEMLKILKSAGCRRVKC